MYVMISYNLVTCRNQTSLTQVLLFSAWPMWLAALMRNENCHTYVLNWENLTNVSALIPKQPSSYQNTDIFLEYTATNEYWEWHFFIKFFFSYFPFTFLEGQKGKTYQIGKNSLDINYGVIFSRHGKMESIEFVVVAYLWRVLHVFNIRVWTLVICYLSVIEWVLAASLYSYQACSL